MNEDILEEEIDEDYPLAGDQLNIINDWLNYISDEIDHGRTSYGELHQLDSIYQIIKGA